MIDPLMRFWGPNEHNQSLLAHWPTVFTINLNLENIASRKSQEIPLPTCLKQFQFNYDQNNVEIRLNDRTKWNYHDHQIYETILLFMKKALKAI